MVTLTQKYEIKKSKPIQRLVALIAHVHVTIHTIDQATAASWMIKAAAHREVFDLMTLTAVLKIAAIN
jgi:hypothetical protein